MKWQPIETAPKDEACILGYCPNDNMYDDLTDVFVVSFNEHIGEWMVQTIQGDNEIVDPTHWMPLPEAP